MQYPEVTYRLVKALKQRSDVHAVAVVGSYASGTQRPDSDIDICAFYRSDLDVVALADCICGEFGLTSSEVQLTTPGGWGNWVDGGGWLTLEGQRVDIVYRCIDRLEKELDHIWAGEIELDYLQAPAFGYFNFTWAAELRSTDPIFDPDGNIAALIKRMDTFPEVLKIKGSSIFLHAAQFASVIGKKALANENWFTARPCCDRAIWAICLALYSANGVWIPAEKRVMKEIVNLKYVPDRLVDRFITIQSSKLTAHSFKTVDSVIQEATELSQKALQRKSAADSGGD
ncbi:MAG: nucleotidyltransferase domain-containing protein [Calditrichia bacterium]